eukprot:g20445.t2
MFPLVLRPVQKSASRLLLAGTHAAVEVTDHGTPLEVQQQPPVAVTWNGMTNDLQPRQMNVLARPLWQGTARWPHAVENLLAQGSGGSQSSSLEQDESEAKANLHDASQLQDGQLSSETGAQCMWPVEAHAVFPPGACVNALRDTSDVHQKIRVQQLYPLDVAEELGDERMMSFLKQLGATKRSKEKASIFSAFGTRSWSSLASLRSTLSSKSSRSSESESSESRLSSPRCKRSCLVRSIRESLDEEVWPAIFMTSDGCFSAGFPVAGVAHSDVTTQPPIQQQPAPSGEARLNTTQLPVEASSGSSSPRAVLRTAASRKQRRRLKAAAEGREDKEMPQQKAPALPGLVAGPRACEAPLSPGPLEMAESCEPQQLWPPTPESTPPCTPREVWRWQSSCKGMSKKPLPRPTRTTSFRNALS